MVQAAAVSTYRWLTLTLRLCILVKQQRLAQRNMLFDLSVYWTTFQLRWINVQTSGVFAVMWMNTQIMSAISTLQDKHSAIFYIQEDRYFPWRNPEEGRVMKLPLSMKLALSIHSPASIEWGRHLFMELWLRHFYVHCRFLSHNSSLYRLRSDWKTAILNDAVTAKNVHHYDKIIHLSYFVTSDSPNAYELPSREIVVAKPDEDMCQGR